MKRNLLIGTAVSAFFLVLALRNVHWDLLWSVLSRTRILPVLLAVTSGLASCFFRAYRWKFMLLPIKPISTPSVFATTMIGLMANNLLPARLGEIVRAHVLGRSEKISRTASFATIVYERIVDVFSLLLLLWLVLAKVPGPRWLRATALWLFVLNFALMLAMIAMERYRRTVGGLVETVTRRLPDRARSRIRRATEGYIEGLGGMVETRTLVPVAILSAPVLGFAVLATYLCLEAVSIHLPLVASATVVVLTAIGSMIPSAPAYLGTTQYACVVALGLFGIGKTEALAFSILFHALQFFPQTAWGLYFLWRADIGLREIAEK